ncbi:MAG: tRNA-dihydrouridine synthase [Bdellovibrionales bacterium]
MFIELAPMEGVVDSIIRDLYTQIGGYDLCVTEFIRVTNQKIPEKVFYKYCPELKNKARTMSGVPVFVQLLGSDPNYMAENALTAKNLGALGIDVNFGCPAKTVNNHGGGASLLKDPSAIFKVLKEMRQALPDSPLTAKVRLGFEDKVLHKEIAKAVEEGGADWIAIHARTKREAYRPPAHWEFIRSMRDEVQIPTIANGDIWNPEDWQKCAEVSGCNDFLLGRGAYARPSLANEIRIKNSSTKNISRVHKRFPFLKNEAPISPNKSELSWVEVKEKVEDFFHKGVEIHGQDFAMRRVKQWTKFLSRNYIESEELFDKLKRLNELPAFKQELTNFKAF